MNKDKNKEFSEPITRARENKEFSEAIKEKKKRILIRTKDEKGNWKEFNREKSLKENGYTGDLKDSKAVTSFMIAQLIASSKKTIKLAEEIERREKELKNLNSYDKALTTATIEKAKKYHSRYNKPDNQYTSHEVIKGALAINIEEFNKGGNLGVATRKLQDFALSEFTKQIDYKGKNAIDRFNVVINIKEYLSITGKEPTPEAVRYFKDRIRTEYTNALQSQRLIVKTQDSKKGTWRKTQIPFFETIAYDSHNIYIYFFPKFAEGLARGKIKHHAKCLYRIKENNPNAYAVASKLEDYYGQYNNRRRNQYNKLSIKVLLENCPTIPTETELKKQKDRHYIRKIIKPFQKALETLVKRDFMTWEYVSNTPLNKEQQEQLNNKNITDFKLFKKLYFSYKLNNFPLDIEP